MTTRFRLPDDLPPDDERAVIAALERYFAEAAAPPDAWTVAGRASNTRMSMLHVRRETPTPWLDADRFPRAQRSTPPYHGRGDAR
jgi:hypothetical protein